MLDHWHDRIEHRAAVAVLAHFTVDGQANADIGQVSEGAADHERRDHCRAVERLCDFPRQALGFQLGLLVAQGQVQRRGETGDRIEDFFTARLGRQWFADQHGDFRFVVHRTTLGRNAETAFQRHHATARLDEQQRLGRHRVVQFLGVFGVIAANAHDFPDREVNARAVDVLVLIAHLPTPAFIDSTEITDQTGNIFPGFMMPFGSNTALTAFMYSISAGERL